MSDAKEKPSSNIGCIILILIAAFLFWVMWVTYDPTLGPSDDPYYDAPTGRTRGGDTY